MGIIIPPEETSVEYPVCSLSCFNKGEIKKDPKHIKSAVLVKENRGVKQGTGF